MLKLQDYSSSLTNDTFSNKAVSFNDYLRLTELSCRYKGYRLFYKVPTVITIISIT